MFCYQCQEAAKGTGCTVQGVCGKTGETAALQDLTMYVLKGIALFADAAREQGLDVRAADARIRGDLFATITNANFDDAVFAEKIRDGLACRDELKQQLAARGVDVPLAGHDAATWTAVSEAELAAKARTVGVLATENEDIRSLRELLTYGLKGMAAYAEHAAHLGHFHEEVNAFLAKGLAAALDDSLGADELVALVLECGRHGVTAMALLDGANTAAYGQPEVTRVNLGVGTRPGILVSGHDLKDLEELLKQTEGTGIDIYTHSEMLPAHAYPAFKKYEHFVGNYGNAWWQQAEEFESFRGAILMTTNCIVPVKDSYRDRIFTTGHAGYPGVPHIPAAAEGEAKDFTAVIERAKASLPPVELETGELVNGFAHATVLGVADQVIDAVKAGAIKRFFVMAGCDGRMKSRGYYRDFALALPEDTVILTAGCAKYKYNKLGLGEIGGIPRVLDAGQCNDSYSLAVIALKLKEAFGLDDINDLPITYNIAWYEQKAVIVLLALLHLGVKNIHLGPTLPAFLSPNVAKVLIDTFGIGGITTVDQDMEQFLAV
ncbi:hydroxylamine reductase [Gorillibacterium sp. CAU 1737]|uniref:hydroxylamine reductase n=1 Tax=Gorillibacterium sp. CAU 1737 TaxID=3140362 RepID=UPI00325FEFDE